MSKILGITITVAALTATQAVDAAPSFYRADHKLRGQLGRQGIEPSIPLRSVSRSYGSQSDRLTARPAPSSRSENYRTFSYEPVDGTHQSPDYHLACGCPAYGALPKSAELPIGGPAERTSLYRPVPLSALVRGAGQTYRGYSYEPARPVYSTPAVPMDRPMGRMMRGPSPRPQTPSYYRADHKLRGF